MNNLYTLKYMLSLAEEQPLLPPSRISLNLPSSEFTRFCEICPYWDGPFFTCTAPPPTNFPIRLLELKPLFFVSTFENIV